MREKVLDLKQLLNKSVSKDVFCLLITFILTVIKSINACDTSINNDSGYLLFTHNDYYYYYSPLLTM